MYRILVTGCGGDIGQSIGKILNQSELSCKVFGSDLNNYHPGKFLFQKCYVLPHCRNRNYLTELKGLVEENDIDWIIPSSEPEIRLFTELQIEHEIFNRKIILPNLLSRQIGFDKYKTALFLKDSGLPYVDSVLFDNNLEWKFPCVVKNRFGSGSKNIKIIKKLEDTMKLNLSDNDLLIQEYIDEAEGEYTSGIFSDGHQIRTITFNRKLSGGYSSFGILESLPKVDRFLHELALKLKLEGSINVQFRLRNGVPYVFEINPRFSSTVLFRHMFGFCDLIWCVLKDSFIPIPDYKSAPSGSCFYKGFQEYIEIKENELLS